MSRLLEQLALQLRFITTSCERYDAGDHAEAVRIAVPLRTLFHNSSAPKKKGRPHSVSLVRQLGAWDEIDMCSSGLPKATSFNITTLRLELAPPAAFFIPKLDELGLRKVRLGYWWAIEPTYIVRDKGAVTRSQLVLSVCNKDGGTHVDPELEPYYERLLTGLDFCQFDPRGLIWREGERPSEADQIQTAKNAHYAALRQMGFEVLGTPYFAAKLGGLASRANVIPPAS